ncbi:MAG: hypothetical protein KatS3mg102_1944 [Planctomycetota bacterium]|nr:MAG: hypothetical protein KatS3mg102_1944 [Planctomycetota bacterium]
MDAGRSIPRSSRTVPSAPGASDAPERGVDPERELQELRQRVLLLERERAALRRERDQLREQVQLLDRLRRHLGSLNERLELLARLTKEITKLNRDAIYDACVTKVPYLVRARFASLYLYDREQGRLVLQRHSHDRAIAHAVAVEDGSASLMVQVLRSGRVQVFTDLDQPAVAGMTAEATAARPHRDMYATRSCIVAPLRAGEEVVGVLNLADRTDGQPFVPEEDLPLITQLAEVLAVALRNCALFELVQHQARTDSLTQLANRQTFFEALEREVERANRYGGKLTLAIADIDRFKVINDNAGHLAGDHVLREVASVLRASVRAADICARYAGDEFALIFPETGLAAARTVAERIRERLARQPLRYGEQQLQVRLSIGLAEHSPETGHGTELIRRADQALYRAKRQGGDRVCA